MEPIILGEFNILPETLPAEGELNLTLNPIDMATYWRRCGAVADFVANFYHNTSALADEGNQNLVSTVFNELIENATKYSTKRDSEIKVNIKLYNTILKMHVENECNQTNFNALTQGVEKLLSEGDLDGLYINKMIAKSENSKDSGIGLLMIIKDYEIKIGLRITSIGNELYKVEVQAYYFMESE